ncbi:MAG TPA: cytochrome c3 family protein [Fimbriimonadaceae bacterium]|nr:cytochrome c3 family protein [Fimbriimonadaceae bacterium]
MKYQALFLGLGIAMLSFGYAGTVQSKEPSQAQKLFARATPDDYMSETGCAECHSEISANFPASPHAALTSDPSLPIDKKGCQGCHGPGHIHQAEENAEVISFTKMSPKESSAACLRCHEKTLSEFHWKRTEHARADLSCVSCHQIHTDTDKALGHGVKKMDPRSAAFVAKVEAKAMLKADEATLCGSCHPASIAEFRGANHHPVPEGRVVCSDCHSAHPSKNEKVSHDAFKGKCVTCHTEKAGPFIYEHDPVAGFTGDGCQECHRPHGTNNPKMLNSVTRGLCAQCHTDKLAQHYPGQTCWTAGCHVASHGSNTDSHFLKP